MANDIAITVGRRLKGIRKEAGLTQAELAALALKSVETVSNFERSKTLSSVRTLALLAERPDCSDGDFFELSSVNLHHEDLFIVALIYKRKLLNERDKILLSGILGLMISHSQN